MCILVVSITSASMILPLDFRTVLTVWYFCFSILLLTLYCLYFYFEKQKLYNHWIDEIFGKVRELKLFRRSCGKNQIESVFDICKLKNNS